MASRGNPTVRRRRLAAILVELRKAARLERDDVVRELLWSPSKLAHYEQARYRPRPADVKQLLDLYQVTDPARREELLTLAKDAQQRGWWQEFGDSVNKAFEVYIGLETEAANVRTFDTDLIHGLLQTEDYATAVMRAGYPPLRPEEIAARIGIRMARQDRLTGPKPVQLWAVIAEEALHRRTGGPQVMRMQLEHLLAVAAEPHITIQVLPFDAGAHAGMGNPFVILDFPDDPDVVYLENLTSHLYLEKPDDVARHEALFDHVRAAALGLEPSLALLDRLTKELWS